MKSISPRKAQIAVMGFSSKTITTQDGQLALDIPRDREGSFEPQIIKSTKHASPVWMTKSSHCMQKE